MVATALLAAACSSASGRKEPAGGSGGTGGEPTPTTGGAGGSGGGAGGSTTPDAGSPSDSAPSSPGVDPPAGQAEAYTATALSPGTGQATDRRPVSVGFYDASVNKTFVSWMGSGGSALVTRRITNRQRRRAE